MKRTKRIAMGSFAALAIYLILLAVISALAVRGTIPESGLLFPVWCAAYAAVFAGACLAAGKGMDGVAEAAACAAAFWCVTMLIGFLSYDGLAFERAGAMLAASGLGALSACLVMRRGRKQRAGKKARRKVNIKRKTQR